MKRLADHFSSRANRYADYAPRCGGLGHQLAVRTKTQCNRLALGGAGPGSPVRYADLVRPSEPGGLQGAGLPLLRSA